jgi:hypothetical protein
MRKLYQKEWFGIDFKSFSVLDPKNIAGASLRIVQVHYAEAL